MKRELFISRMIGTDPLVTMTIEGKIDHLIHQELALFTPAVMAAANQMAIRAWYDDETHSLTIQRDVDAPPRHR